MRLILIRHAETDGNKHYYVGREDIPLNATGRQQAEALANTLVAERIDAIFSSPLSRAVDTAAPLASARGIAVQLRDGLTEIDYGQLQGTRKGERPFRLRTAHLDTPVPEGESLQDVWRRLEPVAAELREALRAGRCLAAVGHYWSNRLLLAILEGRSMQDGLPKGGYKPANASAYALDFEMAGGVVRLERQTWLSAPVGSR